MALPRVSILGCGWLGLPLAETLLKRGYPVKGSTTALEKIPVLKKAGIFPFYLEAGSTLRGEGVKDFFDSEVLVITVPFRRDLSDPKEYQKQIAAIVSECERTEKVRFVIFTSSTSVYPDDIPLATEDLERTGDDPRSRALREIEKSLLSNKKFAATVVRLAGLYGGQRKAGRFLAGQKDLPGAGQPVNLIHQDDAVGIIAEIIRRDVRGEIFNACSDHHPSRKELYLAAARTMDLPPPEFRDEKSASQKIVSNDKVKEILGYKFIHPDPLKLGE